MHLPGSRQGGLGKKLLEQYPWQRFQPHPEWAAFSGDGPSGKISQPTDDSYGPQATGIPELVRIIYVPQAEPIAVRYLDTHTEYSARYFDPISGATTKLGAVRPDAAGLWTCPPPVAMDHDWVVILETMLK